MQEEQEVNAVEEYVEPALEFDCASDSDSNVTAMPVCVNNC